MAGGIATVVDPEMPGGAARIGGRILPGATLRFTAATGGRHPVRGQGERCQDGPTIRRGTVGGRGARAYPHIRGGANDRFQRIQLGISNCDT